MPIDPSRLKYAITRAEALEVVYQTSEDPLQKIEVQILHDQVCGAKPQEIRPVLDKTKTPPMWSIEIPSGGKGGTQRFLALTLEDLCAKLATSQQYATDMIRKLSHQLRDKFETRPEDFQILSSYGDFSL